MQVVVPFAAETPKTRLEPVLSSDERERFARAMLEDVLTATERSGFEPTVLATRPIELETDVRVDDRPLSAAVNAVLESATEPVAVVMADLALATGGALERLFSTDGEVVIAPGRGGGTNALVVRHPEFRVDYHGASYLDHRRIAGEIGARLETVDSYRLATDVDEPADLVEVLLHGGTGSRAALEEAGFRLETSSGRVGVVRGEPPR